jgi:hypothetical protein
MLIFLYRLFNRPSLIRSSQEYLITTFQLSYRNFVRFTFIFLICIVWGGVQSGFTRHVGHFWLIVFAPGDCEDGEYGRMKVGRENLNTRRKPAPAPLCPPQIPLDQTRARTRVAALESQRLTALVMARPFAFLRSVI